MGDQHIADAERWLELRGVPHFVLATKNEGDPNARDHRLAHAAVALGLAAGFGAITADSLLQAVIPFAIVAGPCAFALVHRRRREGRFRYPRPSHLTIATLVAIAVAAAADAVRGDVRPATAAIAVGFALAMLAVAAATPWGLLRILEWAVTHPFREMRQNAKVIAGALPLLLLTVAFLFMTTEIWEVAGDLTAAELAGVVGIFMGLGLGFLLVLARSHIAATERFIDWDRVGDAMGDQRPDTLAALDALESTLVEALRVAPDWTSWDDAQKWLAGHRPASPSPRAPAKPEPKWWRRRQAECTELLHRLRAVPPPPPARLEKVPPLNPRERWNITIVLLFGQVVQVLFVTLLMAIFLLAFGWLAVDHGTLGGWEVSSEHLWRELTEEHVKVTVLLAAFSGLSYAVSAALLPEQRDYFFGELDRKTTQRLAVRALYRGLKGR